MTSEGMVLVPREPTREMIEAMCKTRFDRLMLLRDGKENEGGIVKAVQDDWAAMLAAAPNNPEGE